jgi:hypothetical protein
LFPAVRALLCFAILRCAFIVAAAVALHFPTRLLRFFSNFHRARCVANTTTELRTYLKETRISECNELKQQATQKQRDAKDRGEQKKTSRPGETGATKTAGRWEEQRGRGERHGGR